MKKNEKRLLILAAVMFLAVLLVRVVPSVIDHYREGRAEIGRLEDRIGRYRELIVETGRWAEREYDKQQEVAQYQDWLFSGGSPNVIAPNVQRSLRRAAEEAGLIVRELSPPRSGGSDEWLVFEQEMTFIIEQSQILPFLDLLESARPRLFISDFQIDVQRRGQYTGSVKVTGFSRLPES